MIKYIRIELYIYEVRNRVKYTGNTTVTERRKQGYLFNPNFKTVLIGKGRGWKSRKC